MGTFMPGHKLQYFFYLFFLFYQQETPPSIVFILTPERCFIPLF
jgi:hypothetical protein